jgi:hypothetical protein
MSYRRSNGRNWGVMIATLLAVPLILGWIAVSIVGGALVCADEAARCAGVVWPLVEGIAIIAGAASLVGWLIDLALRRRSAERPARSLATKKASAGRRGTDRWHGAVRASRHKRR